MTWIWASPLALAQVDPFAQIGGVAACDELAAVEAAKGLHLFFGATDALAAVIGLLLWWRLERALWSTWGPRTALGAALAALLGGLGVGLRPLATDAERVLMDNPLCAPHFWLGTLANSAQGLILGAVPAALLAFTLIAVARRFA